MSHAAQAYSRTSHTTGTPREIEAHNALLFNRQLWSIFMSAAEASDNPQPMQIRQKITNIGVFVMTRTVEMQMDPDPAKLKSLIDINCNLAAGLAGQA
jgi:flagellar biosynthesis activator protein FlaF